MSLFHFRSLLWYSSLIFPGHREKWNTVCRVFTSTSQSFFIRTESRSKGWEKWYNGTLPITPFTTTPLKVCLEVVMIQSRPSKRQKTKNEYNLSHPEPLDFILCAQYSLKWIVQLYCSTHFASVMTIIGWPRRYQNKRASNIYAVKFLHAQCNPAAWLDLPNSLRQDELGRKSCLCNFWAEYCDVFTISTVSQNGSHLQENVMCLQIADQQWE